MTRSANALEMTGVCKTFGGTRALADVDVRIEPGEIHALLGHNGSGKSTLIKVLAGVYVPDRGTVAVGGSQLELPMPPGDAQRHGVQFVHQDLGLVPTLNVVENLNLASLAAPGQWRISWRAKAREARRTLARYGLDLAVEQSVAELRPVERAMVAIVRAVEGLREGGPGAHVLVLDEPTVFLPAADVEHLFALVRQVAADGAGVLFVSHDLDEVYAIADRITVLRDGRVAATRAAGAVPREELVELIVGHELARQDAPPQRAHAETAAPALTARGVSGRVVDDVSLELRPGEILGVTGLVGSGFEELPYLLFGGEAAKAGSVSYDGERAHELSGVRPDFALAEGVALIPANRLDDGSVASMSVMENLSTQVYDRYGRGLLLRRRQMLADAQSLLTRYDVRPPDPTLLFGSLSGGNQQKVVMAKWLRWSPRILLLHEPVQGVDVGACEEIFGLIRQAADGGASALCASADYESLARLCDRILIFGRGVVMAELTAGDVTKERIAVECFQSADAAAQGTGS